MRRVRFDMYSTLTFHRTSPLLGLSGSLRDLPASIAPLLSTIEATLHHAFRQRPTILSQ